MLDISNDIKCSKCGKVRYGTEPYQCRNGHLICPQCQPITDVCSRCQVPVDKDVPIKCHVAVDILMDKIFVPCFYKSRGCDKEKMERGEMRHHISVCPFRDNCSNDVIDLPGIVAENNNTAVATGSGSESDNENQNAGVPVVADQDGNSGPEETNHHDEVEHPGPVITTGDQDKDENPGTAIPTSDHDEDEHPGPVISTGYDDEEDGNTGTGKASGPDEDENTGVTGTTCNEDENHATEEIIPYGEAVQDAGAADKGGDENHTSVVAYHEDEGENQEDDTINPVDQPSGTDTEKKDKSMKEEIMRFVSRSGSRKRHTTERYIAQPFGPKRKRAKSERIVSSPAPALCNPVVVAGALRIKPGRPKVVTKKTNSKTVAASSAGRIKPGRPKMIKKKTASKTASVSSLVRILPRRWKLNEVYRCGVCRRVFRSNAGRAVHMRVHKVRTQKRFPCSFCSLDFPEREHVAAHLANFHSSLASCRRNKDGIMLEFYFCMFCNFKFLYTKDELPDHILTKHPNRF